MAAKLTDISSQLLELPFEDRLFLAQKLWESVADFVDLAVEDAWMAVADQRWQDIRSGRVKGIPAEQALSTARAALKK